jgi:hypothetical protein
MEHYVSEIARTLKPRGRCMITYFILTPEARELTEKGKSTFTFKFPLTDCFTINEQVPEAAIAYNENIIRQCFARHGLSIHDPIRYGSWSGRKHFLSFQDVVLATKLDSNGKA